MYTTILRRLISIALLAMIATPLRASASEDYFGAGDGHHGAFVASGAEVVNAYSRLAADVSADDTTLEVTDGTKFAAGDLVLVWQVNGYALPISGDQTEIDLSVQSTGRFELARVASVSTNTLALDSPMAEAFASANTQVVFVPEYTDVTVGAADSIEAMDWDPSLGEGGIAAFLATGTVTVEGTVSATGAGFLGGTDRGGATLEGCTGLDEPSPTGAEKGESISGLDLGGGSPPGGTGRGNRANGGGGGVCHNSGGGGGGHGGLGGLGGRAWGGDPDPVIPGAGRDIGGMGGAAMSYSALTRLTMGGGGGAGHQNNGGGGVGSDGGGVVFVRAGSVLGAGTFEADGLDGGDTLPDGAGGAGAGGLVLVRASGELSCGVASVAGGDGGSAFQGDHGTGGGAAGGHTLIAGTTGTCLVDVTGGQPGVQPDLTDPPGASYGALPGEAGDEEVAAAALVLDTDGDGLFDVNEGLDDTDGDGLADYLDPDDDGDGILTLAEGADPNGDGDASDAIDSNLDGVSDYLDADDDGDGIPTLAEGADPNGDGDASDAIDSDLDGVSDYLDLDSDGDGVADVREAGGTDDDGDGRPDACTDESPADGFCDGMSLINTDATFIGGDALPDYLDLDSDADTVDDAVEAFDPDGDGTADVVPSGNDHDGDGIDDAFDVDCIDVGDPAGCATEGAPVTSGTVIDSDGNGEPNRVQTCGDGYHTALPSGESCDDGDGDDTNACNNSCRYNAGFGPCFDVRNCADEPGMVCDEISSLCQLENGSGDACTEENEASVCVDGVCDESTGQCVACADDLDCVAGERCDENACVLATCGDGVIDAGEICDNGDNNGAAPEACANDCRLNVGAECTDDDDCTGDATCGEDDTCSVPGPRTNDSDGDGIPDPVGELSVEGGGGFGCRVGVARQGTPISVSFLLLLALSLGIRRHSRS